MPLIKLTYRQLGERFGITPDAARMKAKRAVKAGRWRAIPTNHPSDTVYIELDDEDPENAAKDPLPPPAAPPVEETPPAAAPVLDLAPFVALLTESQGRVADLTNQLLEEKEARIADAAELATRGARIAELEAALDRADAERQAAEDVFREELSATNEEMESLRKILGEKAKAVAVVSRTRVRRWIRRGGRGALPE